MRRKDFMRILYAISGILLIPQRLIQYISYFYAVPNPFPPNFDYISLIVIVENISIFLVNSSFVIVFYNALFKKDRLREEFGELNPNNRLNIRIILVIALVFDFLIGLIYRDLIVVIWITVSQALFTLLIEIDTYLRHLNNP